MCQDLRIPCRSGRPPFLIIVTMTALLGLFIPLITAKAEPVEAHLPNDTVKHHMSAFFEVYVGRSLAKNERDQLTREFIDYYGSEICRQDCINGLELFKKFTIVLKEKPGEPEALYLRHRLIQVNYFSPKMKNKLELRLLTEPDPVRVVDPGGKRLMTHRDLVAIANLNIFMRCYAGAPEEQTFSAENIDALTRQFDKLYGDHREARKMPEFMTLAAALWAGLQREWPEMDRDEKLAARDYVRYGAMRPMPRPLYVRLIGLSENQAADLRARDITAAGFARMSNRLGEFFELKALGWFSEFDLQPLVK